MNKRFDVIIVGAGAAGLMCAALCGQKGLKTLLLEQNKQVGKKILISGGGRCNFTNIHASPLNYQGQNQHFSKSAFSQYHPEDFIDLVKSYKIPFFEKHKGQLFCEKSARDIVDLLLKECQKGQVELVLQSTVIEMDKNDLFEVKTQQHTYLGDHLVVATGGLSIPSLGANPIGYQTAKKLGHKLIETMPALAPFVLEEAFVDLSGVSLPVKITVPEISFDEDLLFTHKGLSGPAVLQISLYWTPKQEVTIDFMPSLSFEKFLQRCSPKSYVENELKKILPSRFVDQWMKFYGREKTYLAEWGKKDKLKLEQSLKNWKFIPKSTEGYRKAEVTRGGVSTAQLSSKNLESKIVPRLYFIGEVVDVTGWLGGYNFQWAWASAYACAQSIHPPE